MSRIAVLGAGAGERHWHSLSIARTVMLSPFGHTPAHAEAMKASRENTRFLPGFALPASLALTSSLEEAVTESDVILTVTPSEHLPATVASIAPFLGANHVLVSASKGIQDDTYRLMSEVVADLSPVRFAALGGPSFAREVAAALPTAVTLATTHGDTARQLQKDFSSESLRVYTNDDVVGVEVGGALKNVIALASGVAAGLELGSNASAALITRGMAEITRLAVACGARQETLAGLAGYGDLVLTCTGSLSRNRTVGVELGKGRSLAEILAGLNGKVAEGVRCTSSALGLAKRHGIEMPITREMYGVLYENRSPIDAIRALMTRPGRDE